MFSDDEIREINHMYWVEQDELEAGMHATQIIERVELELQNINVDYSKITFMNYHDDNLVDVSLDGNIYGTFNYIVNKFII